MKKRKIKYILNKLFYIIFMVVSVVSYFRNQYLATYLGTASMYFVGIESYLMGTSLKMDLEIKDMIKNEGYYRPINIWAIYIIAILFTILGILQNINIVNLGTTNNLFLSLIISVYMLYMNEKSYKSALELEIAKQKLIEEYGKEEFEKMEIEHEKLFKEFEEEFKELFNKRK